MLTVEELLRETNKYVSGRVPLEQFDSWFEDNTVDAYTDPALREVYEAVAGAFAQYYFDGVGQEALKTELAAAVRPYTERRLTSRLLPQTPDVQKAWPRTGSANPSLRVLALVS